MSKYTTGEMAKLCNTTVRTVQYYDKRGILTPSQLSEGGRRLYSDDDLKRLNIICYLRSLGISIDNIANIFAEKNCENVISTILNEQIISISNEISKSKRRLADTEKLLKEIQGSEVFSVESINDIIITMENNKNLKKVRTIMVLIGLIIDAIEIAAIAVWVTKGIWIPFAVGMPIAVILGICVFNLYYKNVSYICPECHAVFKPNKKEFFFANHTPKTRKLTCPHCGKKGFCVETGNKN